MLQTLKLFLPALIPSWRFFDGVAPSPRIEFCLIEHLQTLPELWREFRPRPERLSGFDLFLRLFWNCQWNESLFLVSCAERLMMTPSAQCEFEILKRIRRELVRGCVDFTVTPDMRFRLVFIRREGAVLKRSVAYISAVYPCAEPAGP